MTSPTQPPYQPQTGWAGMAQQAHNPQQLSPVPPSALHSPKLGWIAAGAGIAVILGSFLSWGTITAPFIGSISVSGTDGPDGWATAFVGALIAVYGFAAAKQRLPIAVDVLAALAGVGVSVLAGWKILDLSQRVTQMRAQLATGDDEFGLASSMADAVQVRIGPGLWLLAAAGLVAAVSIFVSMYKRLG